MVSSAQVTPDIEPMSGQSIKESEMISKLVMLASAASLFAITGTVYAQDAPEPSQQTQQTAQQQKQEAPAPASNDAAYGGVPSGNSMSASGPSQSECRNRPQCNIFFGH
jgi:hypothetical protein